MKMRKALHERWMSLRATLTISVVVAAIFAACAYEVTPRTKIVIPEMDKAGVVKFLRDAAHELRLDVEEATGWTLPVVTASKAGDTTGAIMIGEAFAAEAGLVPPDLKFFDNVIAEKGGRLYLFGHDRYCRKQGSARWSLSILASVKAVTDFEHAYMGVRRIMPGRTGTEVPKRTAITVPDGLFRVSRPFMENGSGRVFDMMYSIANNIFGNGSYHTYGGHTYNSAVPAKKYLKTHPEYYGIVNGGMSKNVEVNPVLCISRPEVKQIIVDSLVEALDDGADVVELGQQDSREFCECPNCRAYGGPAADTPGEKYWIFHKSIAEEVYRLRPGKTVQIIAYMHTDCRPKTFREFPPNVMVELMTYSDEVFAAWSDYVVPRGFSVYTYMWGNYQAPGLTCKTSTPVLARLARRFVKHNVHSIYRCGYGELFGCEGPASYVFNMLLADPAQDEDALFEDYVTAAYGPAAAHMRKFHRAFDERVAAWAKCFNDDRKWPWPRSSGQDTIKAIYTAPMLDLCAASLSAAERTPGLSEKAKRRLALVRREFDYTRLTAETCLLYDAYRISASMPLFEAIAERVERRRAMIDSLCGEDGRLKQIEGWPDYRYTSAVSKDIMLKNGRLFAPLHEPFNWNIEKMRKALASTIRRKTARVVAKGKATTWQDVGGIQFGKCDYATKFRCFHDDSNFYVEVDAELPDALRFVPKGRDGGCRDQECLDLFIDPLFEKTRNYHFAWNPVEGSCLDEAYGLVSDPLDPEADKFRLSWDGKWDYSVSRTNGRWHSLVTIPFATLGVKRPLPGTKWYLNLGRATFKGNGTQLQLWNPSLSDRGMRDIESMGIVEFE